MAPFVIGFQLDFFIWIDEWWRAWIMVDRVVTAEPLVNAGVARVHRKWSHIPPLRTEEFRRNVVALISRLINELGQLQGLPTVGEEQVWIARIIHNQIPIDGIVVRILVVEFFM